MDKSNGTIMRITPTQYQRFHEISKQHGQILEVRPYEKCFGYSPFLVMSDVVNATNPFSNRSEHSLVTICEGWTMTELGACQRPEMDYSAIPKNKAFEFILWHEIAHNIWNFPFLKVCLATEYSDELKAKIKWINEILADRFAWEKIYPDKPFPSRSLGERTRLHIDSAINELKGHFVLERKKPAPLTPGQYHHIPTSMLKDKRLRRLVGPDAVEPRPWDEWDGEWKAVTARTYSDFSAGRWEALKKTFKTREGAQRASERMKEKTGACSWGAHPHYQAA